VTVCLVSAVLACAAAAFVGGSFNGAPQQKVLRLSRLLEVQRVGPRLPPGRRPPCPRPGGEARPCGMDTDNTNFFCDAGGRRPRTRKAFRRRCGTLTSPRGCRALARRACLPCTRARGAPPPSAWRAAALPPLSLRRGGRIPRRPRWASHASGARTTRWWWAQRQRALRGRLPSP